jgi:type I restriction enzyme, R subunit
MRPYQIAAAERILNRIIDFNQLQKIRAQPPQADISGIPQAGKTLTSFKTAQLACALKNIDKVLFVVDRKDLDYQTMKEYDRFEKGAANRNSSTKVLQKQLEDRDEKGNPPNIKLLTTIQKLDRFIRQNKQHDAYKKHVVLIFDECHRSQFGDMHRAYYESVKNYHIFGFTGTPIFAANSSSGVTRYAQNNRTGFW